MTTPVTPNPRDPIVEWAKEHILKGTAAPWTNPPAGVSQAKAFEVFTNVSMGTNKTPNINTNHAANCGCSTCCMSPCVGRNCVKCDLAQAQAQAAARSASATLGLTSPSGPGVYLNDPTEPEPEPLPVEQQVDTFVGWKRANFFIGRKSIKLTGPFFGKEEFGIDAEARCTKSSAANPGHESPDPTGKCYCGFNVMKTIDLMWAEAGKHRGSGDMPGNCTLEVELYGRVLVGDRGYRASNQVVRAIYLDGDDTCMAVLCRNTPTSMVIGPRDGEFVDIEYVCGGHAAKTDPLRTISMADLSSSIGTEVYAYLPPEKGQTVHDIEEDDDLFS